MTGTSKNNKEKDKKEKEETILARDKLEKCKKMKNKDEQVNYPRMKARACQQ